jgi:hypothetical protein
MKKLIFILSMIICSSAVIAQSDPGKVEQFALLTATEKALSNKVNIKIDVGEFMSVWKQNLLKDAEGKTKEFNTVVDALNYMGKNGWSMVNAYPMASGNTPTYYFLFRKSLPKADAEIK